MGRLPDGGSLNEAWEELRKRDVYITGGKHSRENGQLVQKPRGIPIARRGEAEKNKANVTRREQA